MKISVLIPCYNEEETIVKVITDFRNTVPTADIYVYDNNSNDKTYELARAANAIVRKETRQGKGFVVQKMLKEIESDIYVLVDGDDTYPAENLENLISPIREGWADMVVGDRLTNGKYKIENKRNFHGLGNVLVRSLINLLFKSKVRDVMSGYRVFTKSFAKNYPVLVGGFQLETDMTIFALDRNLVITEVPVAYRDRPLGSVSKLSTFSDGTRVMVTIFNLFRHYKPFVFFSFCSLVLLFLGTVVGLPVISEYLRYNYVYKIPSAILASALIILAMFTFIAGVMLDSIRKLRQELFEVNSKK